MDFKNTGYTSVQSEALGQSEVFLDFQDRLSRVAPVERPVLILGERGTGKELAATRLHFLSKRWQGPLVTLNCSSLSPSLIEAELFGHEKGAFTGATSRRTGRFEAADKGTLFLDEIGSIPMEAQEKILRVVEYGSFERVGSSKSIEVDVRIVSATNSDLSKLSLEGRFKPDLLDRLSFEVLFLPPLRYRKGDVLYLADHFAARMAYELGKSSQPGFSSQAVKALERYDWPGNVRELKNVIERAVYQAETKTINTIVFDPFDSPYAEASSPAIEKREEKEPFSEIKRSGFEMWGTLKKARDNLEITMVRAALEKTKYNQKKAAPLLGISYDQLRGLLRKHKGMIYRGNSC